MTESNQLPIDSVLPLLLQTLERSITVVLSAEPGAGKTTRVPLALLDQTWLQGKRIVMLEPRRMAARRAAEYMAGIMGEKVGGNVGYSIRGETRVSRSTRLEIVTEGILTRRIQSDPALSDVGLVIFDEFHERSIHADTGLALTLSIQEHLRNDARILLMSATLDGLRLSDFLGQAPVIRSQGRSFPITTQYLERPADGPPESLVVSAIRRALFKDDGDILVFLPGQREIRKVAGKLAESGLADNILVHLLFGEASPERQQEALTPSRPGFRKVILSTNIAETSVTIEGVRVVIDSGMARTARFDPRRGMSGLDTVMISKASADQRRGRAGREAPGVCYRLWTEAQHAQLPEFTTPEILVADLAPLALELARWGSPDGEGLRFLDPPPQAHLSQAKALLTRLGATDQQGRLTQHGKSLCEVPAHPRLSHMMIRGKEIGAAATACEVAALLEDRVAGKNTGIELYSRWLIFRSPRPEEKPTAERLKLQAGLFRSAVGVNERDAQEGRLGQLLALAYPDRVGKRRSGSDGRYLLSGGVGAFLPKESGLGREAYLAVGEVEGSGKEVRIRMAEPISEMEIRELFSDQIMLVEEIRWDEREEAVTARRIERLGEIELTVSAITPPPELATEAMIEGLRLLGLQALPWTSRAYSLRDRADWARSFSLVPANFPDLSDSALVSTLDSWLKPFLGGVTSRSQLSRLNFGDIVEAIFTYDQLRLLDTLAPVQLEVASGSRISIEYRPGENPVLPVRIHEMFGQRETPAVGGGKVKVTLHLLSPARRPLAITQDLPNFWKNVYPQVRKEMRGRYPKHDWPEDPANANPKRNSLKNR